jgi:hypothetical protein
VLDRARYEVVVLLGGMLGRHEENFLRLSTHFVRRRCQCDFRFCPRCRALVEIMGQSNATPMLYVLLFMVKTFTFPVNMESEYQELFWRNQNAITTHLSLY